MEELLPLNSQQLSVVNWVEQYWHKHGEFPSPGALKTRFGQELDVNALIEHRTFRLSMLNRGVVVPDASYMPEELTSEQLNAALRFLDVEDKRTLATKLKEIGVSTTQWYAWMKDPKFKEFVLNNSTKDFEESLHLAQQGLIRAIDRGETHAIKFYYELTGRHDANTGNVGNIKVVLAQIIEAIQRHVKDPDVLRAISNDFDIILGGRPVEDTAPVETRLERLL
jgi:hypothetical protein